VSSAQYREHRAREEFSHWLGRLHIELAAGAERRHLDAYVRLAEMCLEWIGRSALRSTLVDQLGEARAKVRARHRLRLIPPTTEDIANDH
jgi:hypothetical protein